MQITKAEFKCSSERISQVPKDNLKDIAFIGRSNVGKSSLINMLTGRSGLAKVSGTPGKTRLVNHFRINDAWYLVDLPGYGYARTSKSMRSGFSKLITDYVLKCEKMHFLFVLVDIRLEPQRIDLQFIEMLGENGVPFGIIFTKADKLSQAQREKSVGRFKAVLAEQWEELPPLFVSSAEKGAGREEILGFIGQCLRETPPAADEHVSDELPGNENEPGSTKTPALEIGDERVSDELSRSENKPDPTKTPATAAAEEKMSGTVCPGETLPSGKSLTEC